MILSMTGYATLTREFPGGSLSVEVKSVNGRFLDLQFRLPDELRAIEPALRELIAAATLPRRSCPFIGRADTSGLSGFSPTARPCPFTGA